MREMACHSTLKSLFFLYVLYSVMHFLTNSFTYFYSIALSGSIIFPLYIFFIILSQQLFIAMSIITSITASIIFDTILITRNNLRYKIQFFISSVSMLEKIVQRNLRHRRQCSTKATCTSTIERNAMLAAISFDV